MKSSYEYDAVIIGGGISGLVCGAYLAKAGLKTLIVEKSASPGGYCVSFKREGFSFDACAQNLGSCSEGGSFLNILRELNVDKGLDIIRYNPSDTIVCPDFKISFWNESDKTIEELSAAFPREAVKIRGFWKFIEKTEILSFNTLRSLTFEELLSQYFKDNRLKAILAAPILGTDGLSASKISAFAAATEYKEYMLSGGYYPKGGMQKLPDALVERFQEYGGRILLENLVTKINIRNGKAEGIMLESGEFISAKYVISACDSRQTFLNLIGRQVLGREFEAKLNQLIPSVSCFILYLGIEGDLSILLQEGVNTWFLPHYDIDAIYNQALCGPAESLNWFMLRLGTDKRSLIAFESADFKDSDYWDKNKERVTSVFIEKLDKAFPGLKRRIAFKDSATPHTLYKWTLNSFGATYGWAILPEQFAVRGLAGVTPIQNLYLTGHWTTLAKGISGVAYLGRDTARIICKKEKLKPLDYLTSPA
ncbi:MAG: NAD(P)/FAD-dependent oxidoreductase [Candidatus Omnitrophota bacterium]